jgi:predicted enzyme related to lactoylglutathione lyase
MEVVMANPFVHVELATTDLDKAKSFYSSLFNWQLQDMDMGGGMSYTMINVGEVARRNRDARCHGGPERRFVFDHHRSDGCGTRTVAAKGEVTPFNPKITPQRHGGHGQEALRPTFLCGSAVNFQT